MALPTAAATGSFAPQPHYCAMHKSKAGRLTNASTWLAHLNADGVKSL